MWGVVKDRKKQDKRWPILDYDILPMRISTAVPIFLPVLWMRYDGRIELNDILARMDNSTHRPEINTFSMRCARWRFDNCLKSWNDAHGKFTTLKEQEEVEGLLSPQQIQANTTRGLTPGPSHGWGPTAIVPVVSRKDRQAQVEAARDARYFNVNNFSGLSESDTDEEVKQGTNKRSRRSRAQHRKKFRHFLKKQEAIKEAIRSAHAGQAVVIPGRSAELMIQLRMPVVFKNVIVVPDEESTSEDDDQRSEMESSNEEGHDEDETREEDISEDMEEDDEGDSCVGGDDNESESPDAGNPEFDEEDDADDEAEYAEDDGEQHGSSTIHSDNNIADSRSQANWIGHWDADMDPILSQPPFCPLGGTFHGPAYNVTLSNRSPERGYESLSTKKRPREGSASEVELLRKRQREDLGPQEIHHKAHLLSAPTDTQADTYPLAMAGRSNVYEQAANSTGLLPSDASLSSAMVAASYNPSISPPDEEHCGHSSPKVSTDLLGSDDSKHASASCVPTSRSFANSPIPGEAALLDEDGENVDFELFLA